MVYLVKVIKPKRFKKTEFNRALRNAARRCGETIIREDYQTIVKTWSTESKPEFKLHTHVSGRTESPSIEIEAIGDIWRYVNEGTKPHPIFAGIYTGKSDKKALAFPSAFSPKTKVGVIGSSAGSSGGNTVTVPYVQHPGTKARNFDAAIAKKRSTWFKRQMEQAMSEAAEASGHRIKK